MISIIITLILVGVLLWFVETYIPMDAAIKTVLRVIVLILVILWLLQTFGLLGPIGSVQLH